MVRSVPAHLEHPRRDVYSLTGTLQRARAGANRASRVEVDRLTEWLWCLRTPIVQAYAVREREGFNLVDTTTAGQEDEILAALAEIAGQVAGARS